MDEGLLDALDAAKQADEIAQGLRGLIVEFETNGTAPSRAEVAALAALTETISFRCRRAANAITEHTASSRASRSDAI